jgi:hypothetical protein
MTSETAADSFAAARLTAAPGCPKCHGKGVYMYDHNHSTICNLCCPHDKGYWQLLEHYGADNGKWCCRAGCGKMIEPDDNVLEGLIHEWQPVAALPLCG